MNEEKQNNFFEFPARKISFWTEKQVFHYQPHFNRRTNQKSSLFTRSPLRWAFGSTNSNETHGFSGGVISKKKGKEKLNEPNKGNGGNN
jgi:hypothetical protein